jgi:hypothetical protein
MVSSVATVATLLSLAEPTAADQSLCPCVCLVFTDL